MGLTARQELKDYLAMLRLEPYEIKEIDIYVERIVVEERISAVNRLSRELKKVVKR